MRLTALAGLLVSALLSSGCLVVGLHPFYEDGSIEFDETLLGTWQSGEDETTISVEAGPWRSYRIALRGPRQEATEYAGYLTRIGGVRLLDLTAAADGAPLVERVHLPLRVQALGDVLTIAPLDYDWFRDQVEHGRLTALRPAIDEQKNVLLAAPTAVLRTWLPSHGAGRFTEEIRCTRRPAG